LPSKKYALGACALLITTAFGSNKTYTVHKGDTVGTIAKKFHITETTLTSINSLGQKFLHPGMKLTIPSSESNVTEYTIAAGDNDWVIAHRLGVSIVSLRQLNPDADWHSLQIGDTLKVPGKANPESPKFKSRYAVVTADSATIRREPSQNADRVTLVDSGTKVTVLDYQHGWYQLKFPKGTVGWMRGDLLSASSPEKPELVATVAAKAKAVAKAPPKLVAKVAAKPQPKFVSKMPVPVRPAIALASISDGKGLPAIKNIVEQPADEPVKTEIAAKAPVAKKKKRTIVASNLDLRAKGTTSELLNRAYRLRGTPYVWGGLTSRGLDCSGFTTTVFKAVGISLPRTSRSQSTIGVAVPRGQLRAGDLLFFRTHRSVRINHVGMYIGENKFIHASSGAGRVRVDNLTGYYATRLAAARRLPAVKTADNAPAPLPVDPRPGHGKKAPVAETPKQPDQEAAKPESPDDQSEVGP